MMSVEEHPTGSETVIVKQRWPIESLAAETEKTVVKHLLYRHALKEGCLREHDEDHARYGHVWHHTHTSSDETAF